MQNCSIKEALERATVDAKQETTAREANCENLRKLVSNRFEAANKRIEELQKHMEDRHKSILDGIDEHRTEVQTTIRNLEIPELREMVKVHGSSLTELRDILDRFRMDGTIQNSLDRFRMELTEDLRTYRISQEGINVQMQEAIDNGRRFQVATCTDLQDQIEANKGKINLEVTNLRVQVAGLLTA